MFFFALRYVHTHICKTQKTTFQQEKENKRQNKQQKQKSLWKIKDKKNKKKTEKDVKLHIQLLTFPT